VPDPAADLARAARAFLDAAAIDVHEEARLITDLWDACDRWEKSQPE
jgi:ribulose 1,5-bisphosphate carboxylase large subunit-like protein